MVVSTSLNKTSDTIRNKARIIILEKEVLNHFLCGFKQFNYLEDN
jgi:hypothetical protein